MKTIITIASAALCCVLLPGAPAQASTPKTAVVTFANCTAMHKRYPHGVGRPGAHDHTSGKPVTNFFRSSALYNANHKSDRDGDGISCEAH